MSTTPSPYERAIQLTISGQATVCLIRLRRLMTDLSPDDRAQIIAEAREMLDRLDQAA
jgi:hypothetical protein